MKIYDMVDSAKPTPNAEGSASRLVRRSDPDEPRVGGWAT
jgi:hypothetical protein